MLERKVRKPLQWGGNGREKPVAQHESSLSHFFLTSHIHTDKSGGWKGIVPTLYLNEEKAKQQCCEDGNKATSQSLNADTFRYSFKTKFLLMKEIRDNKLTLESLA